MSVRLYFLVGAPVSLYFLVAVSELPAAVGIDHVFNAGDSGITCFRIPAIIRTASGTLLAFAEARHGDCSDGNVHEIVMRRSLDEGRSWSALATVIGNSKEKVGNPYPIAMSSGKVALVYVNHTGGSGADLGGGNGVTFSNDDGVTWGHSRDISHDFGKARGSLPGPGAGVQLSSGRLLVVSHYGAYRNDFITYSDDDGQTWATLNHSFPGMDEATLADLGDGEVMLNMRHISEPMKGRAVARSKDGGITWSNISFDAQLIGPVCQGSLAAFDGTVYFSNPDSHISRAHLTVRRSDDGGRTWTSKFEIQSHTSGGYSSLVQGALENGSSGGILYESNEKGCIDFGLFPLDMKLPRQEDTLWV